MKSFWIRNKKSIIAVVGGISFLVILSILFSNITYLFRNISYDRKHIVGIKNEENNIDIVYIGGSAAFTYWEPLKAFKEYGFTSYNLACNTIGAEAILPFIKYSEEYQNPDLYIIDLRPFQYYSDEMVEQSIRNSSDSMDITDIHRYEMIASFLKNREHNKNDVISYLFDIMYYHTHYTNLPTQDAWNMINNTSDSIYKGCELPEKWVYLSEPSDFKTNNTKELLPNAQKELSDILAYCDENHLNVLFVVCPYYIDEEQYALYNAMADEVLSHGYGYVNFNDYYDDMGIDFTSDFYNKSHVNAYGAEKYTSFLGKYLIEMYYLPDHRNDIDYKEWNDGIVGFENYVEYVKKTIDGIKRSAECTLKQGEVIREMTDLSEWSRKVKDNKYSFFVVGNGEMIKTEVPEDKDSLEYLGINLIELFDCENFIKVITDDSHMLNDTNYIRFYGDDDELISLGIKIDHKSYVVIDNKDSACSIKYEEQEYSRRDPEGINIVIFDNYYRTIIDSVTLKSKDGRIVIER